MQLKVNNCGECPFRQWNERLMNYTCEHTEQKKILELQDSSIISRLCPEGGAFEIKTSPITIKLNEDELSDNTEGK